MELNAEFDVKMELSDYEKGWELGFDHGYSHLEDPDTLLSESDEFREGYSDGFVEGKNAKNADDNFIIKSEQNEDWPFDQWSQELEDNSLK